MEEIDNGKRKYKFNGKEFLLSMMMDRKNI